MVKWLLKVFCKLSDEEVKNIEQEFKEAMAELSKLRTI